MNHLNIELFAKEFQEMNFCVNCCITSTQEIFRGLGYHGIFSFQLELKEKLDKYVIQLFVDI